MAVSLLGLVRSQAQLSFSINEDTLDKLIVAFKDRPKVLPFLFLSQTDLSPLIKDLIYRGNADGDISEQQISEFTDIVGTEKTDLYAWRYPIQIGECSILLLHMAFDLNDYETDKEKETAKKMLHCLAAITACCIMDFRDLKKRQNVWTIFDQVSRQTHLQIGAFLAFNPRNGEIRIRTAESIEKDLPAFAENSLGPFHWLFDQSLFNDYLISHELAKSMLNIPTNSAMALFNILKICVNLTEMPFTYERFQHKLPDFTNESLQSNLDKLEELKELHKRLIQEKEIDLLDDKSNLKSTAFTKLLNCFGEKDTIVLALLGPQGIGKSTFFNKLLQHLTESSETYHCFTAGNSSSQTTIGSKVLPIPLTFPTLPGTQVMLMDLEGLGALGIENEEKLFQQNLIKSVLTISSLPCIIVTNEDALKPSIKLYVETISSCARIFRFKVERVFFLFKDQSYDLNAPRNNKMDQWIISLNREYFDGQEIIKLISKPSFTNPEQAITYEAFFEYFIRESNMPKRKESGECLKFKTLMGAAQYIATNNAPRLEAIALTPEEFIQVERFALPQCKKIEQLYDTITGIAETCDLITPFTGAVREFLISETPFELTGNTYRFYKKQLDMQEKSLCLILKDVQDQCRFLFNMTSSQRVRCLIDFVFSYFYMSESYQDYQQLINCFIQSLKEIQKRFPDFPLEMEVVQVNQAAEVGSWTEFWKRMRNFIHLDTRCSYPGDNCLPLEIWKRYRNSAFFTELCKKLILQLLRNL